MPGRNRETEPVREKTDADLVGPLAGQVEEVRGLCSDWDASDLAQLHHLHPHAQQLPLQDGIVRLHEMKHCGHAKAYLEFEVLAAYGMRWRVIIASLYCLEGLDDTLLLRRG